MGVLCLEGVFLTGYFEGYFGLLLDEVDRGL